VSWFSVTIGLVIAVLCAWYCRRLAATKGLNVPLWTVLGFVFTVLAVPVLVLLPLAVDEEAQPDVSASREPPGASASREPPGALGGSEAPVGEAPVGEAPVGDESEGEASAGEKPSGERVSGGASSTSPDVG